MQSYKRFVVCNNCWKSYTLRRIVTVKKPLRQYSLSFLGDMTIPIGRAYGSHPYGRTSTCEFQPMISGRISSGIF